MCRHIRIYRDGRGAWSVAGLSPLPVAGLPSLSASIDYACKECAAAPATIELLIDGLYIAAHQERGWPRRLLAPETDSPSPAMAPANCGVLSIWRRSVAWLKQAAGSSAEGGCSVSLPAPEPRLISPGRSL
jgi:hypothetical protein